jgi:capsular exopolysaccharide synthesis family protein
MANLIIRDQTDRTLREFSYVLFRHKRKVIWFFLSVVIIVGLITFFMPRTYTSEAKLLVKLGRESVSLDPTATASGQIVPVMQHKDTEIKSEMEILRSQDLAEKVVDKIGPEVILPGSIFSFINRSNPKEKRDAAVREIMKRWQITADRDSNIIKISYQANNPKVAHDVVATLINAYLDKHMAVNRTPGSYDFFKEQTDKTGAELASVEARLAELKNRTGIASVDDQRKLLLDREANLNRDVEQTKADYQVSLAKIAATKDLLARLPKTLVLSKTSGVGVEFMRADLYKLQLKEQDLLSKYTEKNFLVQQTRREIRNAQTLLAKEGPATKHVTTGVNNTYAQTEMALVSEEAKSAALQKKTQALGLTLAEVRNEVQAFNENEVQVARVQREKEILEASYREYSKKMEQARIDSALETEKISNISVAQAATFPVQPTSPRPGVNLALAFMLATFGGVGLAFMSERLDNSLKRPEEVEAKLHLPLLTTVPYLDDIPSSHSDETALIPHAQTRCGLFGEAGECYENLCHQLVSNNAAISGVPQVIGVISCHHGEGASTVATNLAAALARKTDERVLFVEANMLTPSAHLTFGMVQNPGLTDVIRDHQDFSISIRSSNRANLDVITSGQGDITVSQLAESKELSEMLDIFKTEYSYVIFDLPPIFKSQPAIQLANKTDGVVLVVGAEGVSWQVAEKAKEKLIQAKVRVIGVVLNKRIYHIPDWLYRKL